MASIKKQWKLEELNENWNGYEVYILNDTESELTPIIMGGK